MVPNAAEAHMFVFMGQRQKCRACTAYLLERQSHMYSWPVGISCGGMKETKNLPSQTRHGSVEILERKVELREEGCSGPLLDDVQPEAGRKFWML